MNVTMFQRQLEAAAAQAVLTSLVIDAIALIVFFACLYYVVRAAIRDGIQESGLIEATRQRTAAPAPELPRRKWSNTTPAQLPEMRADR